MCSAICFIIGLPMNCKICRRPALVLNSFDVALLEDVTLNEADPELAAVDSKWAWLREEVNFKRFFFSTYSKLLNV